MATNRARTTRVVLDRHVNPFEQLTAPQRRRLLVRVLCELVAYDDPALDQSSTGALDDQRLAG